MNVTVENLGPCKKLLRVEVDAPAVDAALEEIMQDFQKQVRLPGFRPGKAPRHLVVKAYAPQIDEEARRKLVSEGYRKAVADQKLRVVGQPDIEEIHFAKGQPFQFAVTLETAPEFELPDYKGLPIKREMAVVTEEDIERALNVLREQRATYLDVARPVQEGDFVVVNYTGTCDDKPITETAPTARGLTEKKDFWLHVAKDSFIPGFTEQLVGAGAGEKRTLNVNFPADFVAKELAGRKGVYEVEVVQVKEKVLPELNDEFAKSFGAEDMAKLRDGVRTDLQNELNYKIKRSARDQLVRELLARVNCELPESIVLSETRNVVYDIVRENQQRGVSKETIEQQKDQIFSVANNSAKDRIKAAFVLGRIAEKEGIKVEQKELTQRVLMLAEQYQLKPEQMVKQLRDRNGFGEIEEQIMSAKVLDFLELNAKVEEVLPTART
ncbi:MAG: trigger factor [Verrucomicrobia bacterium]|nr:MAG: trigger factor [Verrucomicrobiota bacterium]